MTRVMKAVSVMAVCIVALMMAPRGFAQSTFPITLEVVGENNPSVAASVDNGSFAQQFALSSSAYVSRVDLGLVYRNGSGANVPPTACTFTVSVTDSFVLKNDGSGEANLGFIYLQRNESLSIPALAAGVPTIDVFSDSFPAVLLPARSYYLVVDLDGGPNSCGLEADTGAVHVAWALNIDGSPHVGTIGQASSYPQGDPTATFAFDLAGPLIIPPVGGSKFERARLVAGPITPAPGSPVEAQVGFVNAETGALLGNLTPVTLSPGQLQSVDLDLTPLVARVGQRIEVQPVIVQTPSAAGERNPGPANISATVQVLDELTGFETVLAPVRQQAVVVGPGGEEIYPDVLGRLQTARFAILATPTDSCVAQVGFNDVNGNALISAVQVNLPPGTGTTVDLNGDTLGLGFGQSIEVQPVLTLSLPVGAVPQNSVCNASVEVFDQVTGRTWTHQSVFVGLPAVQTPAAGTPGTPGVPTSAVGTQ